MTSIPCDTLKCQALPKQDRSPVVWRVGGKYYCNSCFLNALEAGRFEINARIVRLYSDDELYQDTRIQKRRKRVPQTTEGMMARAHA